MSEQSNQYPCKQPTVERLHSCPICDSSAIKPLYTVHDTLHFLEGEFQLAGCCECKVRFLATRPTLQSIAHYYPKQYYTHRVAYESGSLKKSLQRMAYDHFYKVRTSLLHQIVYGVFKSHINMLPPRKRPLSTMLDFGCGNGNLIRLYSQYGFIVDGYEVDSEAAQIARNHARYIFTGDVFETDFPEKYDVIIMNQVLEHLHDPVRVLRHIVSSLYDDGHLIISVPNADSLDFSILRDCWYAFQAPTHLAHYNLESLKALVGNCGLYIIQHSYAPALKALSPSTLKRHLALIDRTGKGHGFLMKAAYMASSVLGVVPILSRRKSDRITVYCRKITA